MIDDEENETPGSLEAFEAPAPRHENSRQDDIMPEGADLLFWLNSFATGPFSRYLAEYPQPRIAWYPSAGGDFRDTYYLSPAFAGVDKSAGKVNETFPDLFIHTDYSDWHADDFFNQPDNNRGVPCRFKVDIVEELPNIHNLALDPEIVDFPYENAQLGRVFFLRVMVLLPEAQPIPQYDLYVFMENEQFCHNYLLRSPTRVSKVIKVRYGTGFGGAKGTGSWILQVLKRIGCDTYINDGVDKIDGGDQAAMRIYPNLSGTPAELIPYRKMPAENWSDHGEISWNMLR